VRRVKRVGNFHIFAAIITRDVAQRRLIDDLLDLFAALAACHGVPDRVGKLSQEDVKKRREPARTIAAKCPKSNRNNKERQS